MKSRRFRQDTHFEGGWLNLCYCISAIRSSKTTHLDWVLEKIWNICGWCELELPLVGLPKWWQEKWQGDSQTTIGEKSNEWAISVYW